ncbi:unnamed protein product [Polarella glacialis]|uniref:Ion transport domain-containing protein n=1 Tax=Polarella glacialis TaxID=89957 RepID=A0A813DC61_POLGL|nr:unnamed protein product [Polarella glacialis]
MLDVWEQARARITSMQQLESAASSKRKQRVAEMDAAESGAVDPNRTLLRSASRHSLEGTDAKRSWIDNRLQRFVVQPSSSKRVFWEFMGLIMVCYDIVIIPLQLLDPPEDTFYFVMSWATRMFWTLDLIFSFFTGYISQAAQGMIETRVTKIAVQFVKTRLALDLTIVTCDWLEVVLQAAEGGAGNGNAFRLISMLRAIRPFRLLRITKARNMTDFVLGHIRSEGAMIASYVLAIVLMLISMIHVIACLWYGLLVSTWGSGKGSERWEAMQGSVTERYMYAFHFVLALFVGEHIMLPQSISQRFFTVVVLIIAFVVGASFVGGLTTAMTRLQIIASQRSSQFAALNRYLSDCNISRLLSIRVQRNARHALKERKRNTPESKVELLQVISEPLRAEIHYEVPWLQSVLLLFLLLLVVVVSCCCFVLFIYILSPKCI